MKSLRERVAAMVFPRTPSQVHAVIRRRDRVIKAAIAFRHAKNDFSETKTGELIAAVDELERYENTLRRKPVEPGKGKA